MAEEHWDSINNSGEESMWGLTAEKHSGDFNLDSLGIELDMELDINEFVLFHTDITELLGNCNEPNKHSTKNVDMEPSLKNQTQVVEKREEELPSKSNSNFRKESRKQQHIIRTDVHVADQSGGGKPLPLYKHRLDGNTSEAKRKIIKATRSHEYREQKRQETENLRKENQHLREMSLMKDNQIKQLQQKVSELNLMLQEKHD